MLKDKRVNHLPGVTLFDLESKVLMLSYLKGGDEVNQEEKFTKKVSKYIPSNTKQQCNAPGRENQGEQQTWWDNITN